MKPHWCSQMFTSDLRVTSTPLFHSFIVWLNRFIVLKFVRFINKRDCIKSLAPSRLIHQNIRKDLSSRLAYLCPPTTHFKTAFKSVSQLQSIRLQKQKSHLKAQYHFIPWPHYLAPPLHNACSGEYKELFLP